MPYIPRIAHCHGAGCPLQHRCLRFCLNIEAHRRALTRYAAYTQPAYNYQTGKCENYLHFDDNPTTTTTP